MDVTTSHKFTSTNIRVQLRSSICVSNENEGRPCNVNAFKVTPSEPLSTFQLLRLVTNGHCSLNVTMGVGSCWSWNSCNLPK